MNTYQPKPYEYYISKCPYYTGKKDADYGKHQNIANCEQRWVDAHFSDEGLKQIKEDIQRYKDFGLGGFNKDDGTPISLKATYFLLWNKTVDGLGSAEKFKEAYIAMKREVFLECCRYYKGEEENENAENLHGNDALFFGYEQGWVINARSAPWDWTEEEQHIVESTADAAFVDAVSVYENVPPSLVGLLFNRYMHWGGGYHPIEVERRNFIHWFRREYLKKQE